VAKGKTFTVNTSYGTVQVLGTKFNVRKRKDLFEVSCYEGRVSVSLSGRTAVLTAGKSIAMVNGNLRDVRSFSDPQPLWLMEGTSFENVPLSMVLEELQRQYDVKVKIGDKALLDKKFTGSFVNNDLGKAVEVISYIMDLKYDLKDNKVVELYAE
jgi:ferric-dicitrate binding protein FerR (iron transport regulator)